MQRFDKNVKPDTSHTVISSTTDNTRLFCAFCGKPIIANARFCSFCGKEQISAVPNSPTKPTVLTEPVSCSSIPKPSGKAIILPILGISLAVLAIIVWNLLGLIKFRTDYLEILAFSGSPRKTVDHDLPLYRLWFVGFAVSVILMLAAIICVIYYMISHGKSILKAPVILLMILCILIYAASVSNKLPNIIRNYDTVKTLDAKNTTSDFIPYDHKRDG
ncbi:MAG: zinc ribbon domain-containing protein [Clostridiales bacterium]|nr:zinc ribbon domain-containing protein [Clostridiales bacterium]